MGKTKQEKKFDRNVEISAPILDPEIIKQIHSPPKDQKRDIRHGGFKALLSDLNSQDSTDELTPITENHLPSYIGISCAVSGYSNYSSYGRKPLDQSLKTETKAHKLATTSSKQTQPNRSQTNSPLAVRIEQHNIHHVTIDKSNINSADQERKELTEKLTASAAERRSSPSPIPPTEDDRHHGAYVGARYCPMPEPSKLVHKHIPLLGIDDDVDEDEVVVEDLNKVEKKIASLYGENFVEDWKEAMSHKSKKELHEERQTEKEGAPMNLRESVNLKPTPPKAPQPDEPIQVDIPTPNVKVLANVEKQFLNRLLTDENPPMPKSPSPQPTSPISPKLNSPTRDTGARHQQQQPDFNNRQESVKTPVSPSSHHEQSPVTPNSPDKTVEPVTSAGDELDQVIESTEVSPQARDSPAHDSPAPSGSSKHSLIDVTQLHSNEHSTNEPLITLGDSPVATELVQEGQQQQLVDLVDDEHILNAQLEHQVDHSDEVEISKGQQAERATLETPTQADFTDEEVQAATSNEPHRSRSSSDSSQVEAKSPESQISSSTVERVPLDKQQQHHDFDQSEDHIEYEIQAQSPPVNNESSPVKVVEKPDDDSLLVTSGEAVTQDSDNLVSLLLESNAAELVSETNNNLEDQLKANDDLIKTSVDQAVDDNAGQVQDESHVEIETKTSATGEQQPQASGKNEEEIKDGHYFLDLLKKEESFILERVRLAEQLLAEHQQEMDEERLGRIHSAIGKANLLINKKCNQFKELCEKSISGDANDQYAVLNDDLAGFWDMICIQITDVRKSLENP